MEDLKNFQFHNSEEAKKALEQLNGFELAGRAMKVNTVSDRADGYVGGSYLDNDDMERAGIDLGESQNEDEPPELVQNKQNRVRWDELDIVKQFSRPSLYIVRGYKICFDPFFTIFNLPQNECQPGCSTSAFP